MSKISAIRCEFLSEAVGKHPEWQKGEDVNYKTEIELGEVLWEVGSMND